MLALLSERLSRFPNFGVCLDYAHASCFGKTVPIESWVERLTPYVKHMHINDNDLTHDLHLPVGSGRIDWIKFREYYYEYFSEVSILIDTSRPEDQRMLTISSGTF